MSEIDHNLLIPLKTLCKTCVLPEARPNLNSISVRNSLRNFAYTHNYVEMSKLIRQGVISRDEAIKDLE